MWSGLWGRAVLQGNPGMCVCPSHRTCFRRCSQDCSARPLHAAVQAAAIAPGRARPARRGPSGRVLRGRRPRQPHRAQRAGSGPAKPVCAASAACRPWRCLHPPRAHARRPVPAHRACSGTTPPKHLRPAHFRVPLPLLRGGAIGSSFGADDFRGWEVGRSQSNHSRPRPGRWWGRVDLGTPSPVARARHLPPPCVMGTFSKHDPARSLDPRTTGPSCPYPPYSPWGGALQAGDKGYLRLQSPQAGLG